MPAAITITGVNQREREHLDHEHIGVRNDLLRDVVQVGTGTPAFIGFRGVGRSSCSVLLKSGKLHRSLAGKLPHLPLPS